MCENDEEDDSHEGDDENADEDPENEATESTFSRIGESSGPIWTSWKTIEIGIGTNWKSTVTR